MSTRIGPFEITRTNRVFYEDVDMNEKVIDQDYYLEIVFKYKDTSFKHHNMKDIIPAPWFLWPVLGLLNNILSKKEGVISILRFYEQNPTIRGTFENGVIRLWALNGELDVGDGLTFYRDMLRYSIGERKARIVAGDVTSTKLEKFMFYPYWDLSKDEFPELE